MRLTMLLRKCTFWTVLFFFKWNIILAFIHNWQGKKRGCKHQEAIHWLFTHPTNDRARCKWNSRHLILQRNRIMPISFLHIHTRLCVSGGGGECQNVKKWNAERCGCAALQRPRSELTPSGWAASFTTSPLPCYVLTGLPVEGHCHTFTRLCFCCDVLSISLSESHKLLSTGVETAGKHHNKRHGNIVDASTQEVRL